MKKLKTLKDIFEVEDEVDNVAIKILKREAIKWYNYMTKYYKGTLGEPMIFIKEFFNLTQEDIEEQTE